MPANEKCCECGHLLSIHKNGECTGGARTVQVPGVGNCVVPCKCKRTK